MTFVIPEGRVHVPDEVKVCTEARPESKPELLPLFVSVTPEGIVKVSPDVPSVTVPEAVRGESLSVFTSLI
jgi:hypothetical protein